MKRIWISVCLLVSVGVPCGAWHLSRARADTPALSDAGVLDAGSGSAISIPTTPADRLHNPITDPFGTVGDLQTYWSYGWSTLLLLCTWILLELLAWAGQKKDIAWMAWFGTGYRAFVIAAGSSVIASMFNVLALGGKWAAALAAGISALIAYKQAKKT